jgi:aspartyl/asparaginyl beta-hydroxylase (cupin superfamily)
MLDAEFARFAELLLRLPAGEFREAMVAGGEHERRGDRKQAAASYRIALQRIPPGLPQDLRPLLARAQSVSQANDRDLEAFIDDRLSALRESYAGLPLGRFDRCVETLLRKRRIYRPAPSFLYFPQLPAIEFYDREMFPWLDALEAAADDIRGELLEVMSDGAAPLEPYVSVDGAPLPQWRELNKSRRWSVFYFWRAGEAVAENLARCPKTAQALSHWPRCELRGTGPSAVFSILDARTRIPPHTGVNNARLIAHLPLVVPPGCGFRVGAETRAWTPGEAFVFDDTIEHEAWNDSDEPRAVLIVDLWNPYLSEAEQRLVSELTATVGDYYAESPVHSGVV